MKKKKKQQENKLINLPNIKQKMHKNKRQTKFIKPNKIKMNTKQKCTYYLELSYKATRI